MESIIQRLNNLQSFQLILKFPKFLTKKVFSFKKVLFCSLHWIKMKHWRFISHSSHNPYSDPSLISDVLNKFLYSNTAPFWRTLPKAHTFKARSFLRVMIPAFLHKTDDLFGWTAWNKALVWTISFTHTLADLVLTDSIWKTKNRTMQAHWKCSTLHKAVTYLEPETCTGPFYSLHDGAEAQQTIDSLFHTLTITHFTSYVNLTCLNPKNPGLSSKSEPRHGVGLMLVH